VVLCPSALEAIVHLREALPSLTAELRGRSLLVVPTGAPQFSAADIGRTLAVEVLPPIPDDPGAAAALANRRSVKRLERTRLLRWAADTLGALGIEAAPSVQPEVLQGPAEPTEAPPRATSAADPTDMRQPDESLDRTTSEGQLAGAASATTREVV
jgi:hypothetical protein